MFPGLQRGHMNNIAAAVIAFKKVLEPAFRNYAERILQNGQVLADAIGELSR